MRRAALIPLAASALMIAVAPSVSQEQQRRPLPPPGGAVQQQQPPRQSQPLPPPGGAMQQQPRQSQPLPPPGPAGQQMQRGPQQQPQQQAAPPAAPPKPYAPVAIAAPKPIADPAFEAFRNRLAEVAKRKDRAGLAKMVVAKDFFWFGEKGDIADKKRSGSDNLARALNLAAKDGSGWDALIGYASDPTGMAFPERKETYCAPADPEFDFKMFENLVKESGTEENEWGYPVQPGIEVRAEAKPNAPVIDKLGMHFVRVMEDDGPEPPADQVPMLKVAAPSGKVGFVPIDALSPLGNDQLCYVRDATGWRIAGFIGGEQP
jgi:hypothetical protein